MSKRTFKLRGPLMRRVPVQVVEAARAAAGDEPEKPAAYEIVVSTEDPYRRYDWWSGRFYDEVLGHDPEEVDMRYFENGAAVLEEHRGPQIGVVDKAWLDPEKRQLRARIRFSQVEPRAAIVEGKIREGVMRHVSVGYSVEEYTTVKTYPDGDGTDQVRATRWTPYETSPVGIPADLGAGFGRAKQDEAVEVEVPWLPGTEGDAMLNKDKPGGVAVDDSPAAQARTREQEVQDIMVLCDGYGATREQEREWVGAKLTADQVARKILELRMTKPEPQPRDLLSAVGERERRRYRYGEAILGMWKHAMQIEKFSGLPAEMHQEITRQRSSDIKEHGGFYVPWDLRTEQQQWDEYDRRIQLRVLDSKTPTKGPETIFEEAGELIEILRQEAIAGRLGVRFLPGLTAPVAFPKKTGRLTAYWVGENPPADVTASDLLFGLAHLQPKTAQANTGFSKQFLQQTSLQAEAEIRSELTEEHRLLLDKAVFYGKGSAFEPTGIYKAPDVNVRAVGGIPDYADVIDSITSIAADNALRGTPRWVTTPQMAGKLKQTPEHATLPAAGWIWTGTVLEGTMGGYPGLASNQISALMTGSEETGGAEHGAIVGDWTQGIVGLFAGLEVLVDPYSKKNRGLIEVTTFQMMDFVLRHGESFCKWTGATIV